MEILKILNRQRMASKPKSTQAVDLSFNLKF